MRASFFVAAVMALLATPALAQFPPPGVYACVASDGAPLGELTLFVAGDYSFKDAAGNSASGQVASAGTDINPLSGPLKDMGVAGGFVTDGGVTVLSFAATDGPQFSCK